MDNEDDNIVSRGFRQKLETLLDTYDISIQEDTEEMRTMKNYLSHANDLMRKDIVDFIKRKAKVGAGELRPGNFGTARTVGGGDRLRAKLRHDSRRDTSVASGLVDREGGDTVGHFIGVGR